MEHGRIAEDEIELLPYENDETHDNESERIVLKPSPWYIIIPMFAITFAYGLVMIPIYDVLTTVFCYKYYKEQSINGSNIPEDQCHIPEIQSMISNYLVLNMLLSYIATLLMANYYGGLSDRKGRRIVMKVSMVGGIITFTCAVFILKFHTTLNAYVLLIIPAIRGLLANETILFSTANAYLSDCTAAENRTLAFGRMIAAIHLGTTLGPFFSSFLIKQTGTIASIFYLAILIHICFLLYITFVLPESNDISEYKEKPKQTILQRMNIFSAFSIFYRTPSKYANRWALLFLAIIHFMTTMSDAAPTMLYAMLRFGWTSYEGGFFTSARSFTSLLVLLAVLPIISKLFHKLTSKKQYEICLDSSIGYKKETFQMITLDIGLTRVGFIINTIAFVIFGLATTPTAFTMAAILQALSSVASPSFRSLMTALVDPSQLGELWGAITVVETCSMPLFPVCLT
ncbi:hypothetical protein G6F37_000532 [Rhizopus arrhizus]|nr:hypothetical protein G6F38_004896 [Rhizopus arrhizus]KAG1164161.1 hypothetical protein G6F37_000532 [Rhizopus arrhizus]